MAYVIETMTGEMLSSGQTRGQILRGLASLGYDNRDIPAMPKLGRCIVINPPIYTGLKPARIFQR